MSAKHILHLLTPSRHASPFDINMALDAGYDAVLPYTGVMADEVVPLVQDAMFSRPPSDAAKTGIFLGGKDALGALDMLAAAKAALFPPFEISLFADPAGSFTTAAAMVACIEKLLHSHGHTLPGTRIVVFGATGVVGFSSAVIAALEGAKVTLAGHDGVTRVARSSAEISDRFSVATMPADASSEDLKSTLLQQADVAICAGRAGLQILNLAQLKATKQLLVAADVNAVPPAGIEGLETNQNGLPIGDSQVLGIGPLAIGNIKYQTQARLLRKMIETAKAQCYDFRDAFALARTLV